MYAQGLILLILVADGTLKLSNAAGEVQTPGHAFRAYCDRRFDVIAFCVIEGATSADLVHVWNNFKSDPHYRHFWNDNGSFMGVFMAAIQFNEHAVRAIGGPTKYKLADADLLAKRRIITAEGNLEHRCSSLCEITSEDMRGIND